MKNGKRPTREQRKLMEAWKLNSADWLVVKDTPENMVVVHRHFASQTRTIPKEGRS